MRRPSNPRGAIGAAFVSGVLLAGCATARPPPPGAVHAAGGAPQVVTREVVKVPVAVKAACVPKSLPPAPRYPDSDIALRDAGGAADRYQLLAAGRILREKRLAVLERVIEGCR